MGRRELSQTGEDRDELAVVSFGRLKWRWLWWSALAVLLGLNGLRVSEARGANIEDLAIQRGHRTLAILGKGNKPAVIPLVPRTARTVDLAVGERHEGPILCRRDGQRLDRRTAPSVGPVDRQAGRPDRGASRRPPHHHHL